VWANNEESFYQDKIMHEKNEVEKLFTEKEL